MNKMHRESIYPQNIVFIDIETVGCVDDFPKMEPGLQLLWEKKAKQIDGGEGLNSAQLFRKRGAIYSEFGKIIVIAIGFVSKSAEGEVELRIKALKNIEERELLTSFRDTINKFDQAKIRFCGHNIKEFDLPYICRRMVVNSLKLPEALNCSGKKPWEIPHIDTMEMWSFGDRKNFTSLHLLATILGIESSKHSMDGSQVHDVYYVEKNLEKISDYCREDVKVVAQLFFRLKDLSVIDQNNVIFL
jgi:uncharacterized protein YprB with RNaseH-like and TPR domain